MIAEPTPDPAGPPPLTHRPGRGLDRRTIALAVGGVVVGGLLAFFLLGRAGSSDDAADANPVVINGITTATPDDEHQPPLDLEPGASCTADLDGLRAEGRITNRTDEPWGYRLKVLWEDSGVIVAEGTTLLQPLAPGATVPFRVVSPTIGTAATTCRVSEIDRTAP